MNATSKRKPSNREGQEVRDVVELFCEHAAYRPDAIALTWEGKSWSYAQLDTVSDQLALQLQNIGVTAESFVALYLSRSFFQVAAILAVLKAGGAYVPIDPDYPEERVRMMIADSGARYLMVDASGPNPPVELGVSMIVIEDHAATHPITLSKTPARLVRSDNAAYMIYTSGSTGRPKGVVVTRHNVNRLFTATEGLFDFGPDCIWSLFHSYAFDFSVWELWGALAYGGQLVIVPWDTARSTERFYDLLKYNRVSVLNQTPSAFYNLVRVDQSNGSSRLDALRYVIFGGEALDLPRLVPWFERYGDRQPRLVNMYGITETTVHTTFRALCQKDTEQRGSPIGRPLPDLEVYLVDFQGNLVEKGDPGEIWVSGEGVARGYHNRPELTEERFVPDPRLPSRRVYRSGDLARKRADGDLEYLGRIDAQVKVRGYRIELGEIEATLRQCPGVADAVAVTYSFGESLQIVGYIVPNSTDPPRFADLQAFLRERLPPYMVCNRFCLIDKIPITIHGKVDRQALPEPSRRRTELVASFLAPRTDLERRLANIFSDVNGIEMVGIQDNFFALGGTSLLATQLSTRIIEEFAVQITLKDIFIHPTVMTLAEEIRKRSSLPQQPSRFTVSSIPRTEYMPLTHAQERVWLIQKLSPVSVAYTLSASLRFRGTLDVAALRVALAGLVARHEVLRTTFPQIDKQPVQHIHVQGVVPLEEFSLEHLDLPSAQQEVERYRAAATQRAFDLERLPLIEWSLFRLSDKEHILLHREHHLLHDGWSFFILLRDFLELYRAAYEKRPVRLPDLSVQIADFAVAQRRWVETGIFADQLRFWREALHNCPVLISLPADHPRPSEISYKGDTIRFRLADDLILLAKGLGRSEGSTFYMTMLAPFVALLWNLTGQTDICIGTGVANRRTPESEQIVGMVINNIVLRFDMQKGRTLREFLRYVRSVVLAALDNQDIPFDVVVRDLNRPHQVGIHPLCQVFFTSYDGPEPDEKLPNLEIITELGLSSHSAKFDLNIILLSGPDRIGGLAGHDPANNKQVTVIWEYSTDLFERTTMEHMVERYLYVLRQGLTNPDMPMDEIRWTTVEEERWLRKVSCGLSRPYPRDASLPELFERQVAMRPWDIALIDGLERTTYRELDQRANRLAHRLHDQRISGERVVGILLERGAAAVTTMLGILKAGAAYLPLNPLDPPLRLATLIAEARATTIVTRRDLADRLAHVDLPLVFLEELPDNETVSKSDKSKVPAVDGTGLACVFFTSGSTGRPKGVEVLHRGIIRLLFGQDYAHFGPDEKILQLAPLTFDASTFEIWAALLHGGTLVISPEDVPDLMRLDRIIRDYKITTIWLNSSLFNLVIDERPDLLQPIRQLLIGGEALSVAHVRRALALLPETSIVNGYGPTENTTFSCCYPIPSKLPEDLLSIPIGYPLANSTAYVLDERLRPTAQGVSGEIFLGGDGVVRGYCGRAELTAECFYPDPFSPNEGARMYRSGDLGAILPDGTIQFRGRRDDQLKIRGFRIEPREIESALNKVPGVRTCAIVAQADESCGKRLTAFIVPCVPWPDTRTLQNNLRQQLPGYMVPDQFIFLDQLPLTPHGKLDRERLTATVSRAKFMSDRSVNTPRTLLESKVLHVFQEILGNEEIGIHDDFFSIGGHSLLAIRLIGRLNEQLSANIDLRWLFRNPTIVGLCAAITGTQEDAPPSMLGAYLIPVRENGMGRPIFFVPGGDGSLGAMEVYGRLANYIPDRPFWGLCSTSSDGTWRMLQPNVKRLAAKFIQEMKRIQPQGAYDLAGGCTGGVIAFEMARQLVDNGEEVHRIVLLDTQFPDTYQYMRAVVRGVCSRLRYYLHRGLSLRRDKLGRHGDFVYKLISGFLPFTELEAPREIHPLWITFANRTMRYCAKPYAGKLHLLLSEQMSESGIEATWSRMAKGRVSVTLITGDHETYIRTYIDRTGIAFCNLMAE
jgi:amino acid adenylation domain-containing protein